MPLKPLDDLARWTCIALYACAGVYALNAFGLFGNLSQLDQAAAYERSVGQTIYLEAAPSGDFVALEFAAVVLTAIVFLAFLHRAYANVGVIAPMEKRYDTGWAVGSWFIPILNLFRPKQIANDIWRGSDGSNVPGAFNWWWALFLIGNVVAGYNYYGNSPMTLTIDQARTTAYVQAVGEVLLVAAALCGATMVRNIARRQRVRAELIGRHRDASFLATPERIAPQAG